jgi:hypothetical protein
VITGTPGRRHWLANIRADNSVLITTTYGEFLGNAIEIHDWDVRHRVFTDPSTSWYNSQAELDALIATAPMVEIVNIRRL